MKKLIALSTVLLVLISTTQAQTDSTKAKKWQGHPNGGFNRPQQFHQPGRQQGGGGFGNYAGGGVGNHRRMPFGHGGGWGRDRQGFRPHLSPEQQKQATAINADYQKQLTTLRSNDKQTLGEFKKQSAALQKQRQQKIEALYTPQQKEQIAKAKKRMDDERQIRAAANLERMKLNLNLTEDQVAKIKSQQTSLQSQVKAIHDNDNLLPDQKREQMKDLMAKQKDNMKAILTPEQQTKLDSLHKGFGKEPFNRMRPPFTR